LTGSGPSPSTNGSAPPLLELEDVSVSYGPFRALFGVSLTVPAGSAVALLGSNGAGKSTVARVATGLVPLNSGRIRFDGVDVTGYPAHRLAALGMSHAPEGRSIFSSLSVEENLVLIFRQALGRKGMQTALDKAYLSFPRLKERRKQNAGTLSGGEQRMLSLAKVLANPPRLLVVDELSLGLAPIIVDEVFSTLKTIRQEGTSILVVEQHVTSALDLADYAVLLSQGSVLHQGPVDELGNMVDKLLPGASA
jgi:branched-chain amino acid transport system ATP-binding protein